MFAHIYKPAKTAMTSANLLRTKDWVLDYEPATPREAEPLMGWTASGDMLSQVRLFFETKEEAISYAQENHIPYRVFEPHPRALLKQSYGDNFKYGRIGSWTH
jgi:ETC complex I subunit conserved region